MRLFEKCYKLIGAILNNMRDVTISLRGQSNSYAILQESHRIEKGLTINNPRKKWGWKKADRLAILLRDEAKIPQKDSFSIDTGSAVLKAYLNKKNEDEPELANQFLVSHPYIKKMINESSAKGGSYIFSTSINEFKNNSDVIEKLFSTRHSIRDFDDREITKDILEKAIQLALFCPSACNRQPSKVYCIDKSVRNGLTNENSYNANKYLIVTVDMKAFTTGEYGDWVVSASIFVGYLSLALHYLGIGNCIIRKNMLFGDKYNDRLRKTCRIPKNEKIILEMAIGYYKEDNVVAFSNRRSPKSIITYV